MGKKKINTIEMTRKIRDEHAKRLAGKTHAERIAFYQEQAKKIEEKLPVLLSELAADRERKGDYANVDTIGKQIREKRASYKKKK